MPFASFQNDVNDTVPVTSAWWTRRAALQRARPRVVRSLSAGYGRTIDNVFTVVAARATGARDLFTTSTYSHPLAPSYVVPQQGKKLRPGIPASPSVARGSSGAVLSWAYEWAAARHEVWRARPPSGKRTRLVTTRLMRFVERSGSLGPAIG